MSSPTWDVDADGNFSTGTNWTTSPSAPAPGDFVTLGNIISAPRTVTIDTPTNVSGIQITDEYTIDGTGANPLTLSGGAEISVSAGDPTISAVIAGSVGLKKTGSGTATINGANTYTGTTSVQGGDLRVEIIGSIDNTVSGTLDIAAGADLILAGDPNMTGNGFSGSIVPDITGDGDLILSASLTSETVTLNSAKTFDGRVLLNNGTLVVSNASGLGTGDPNDNDTRTEVAGSVVVDGETVVSSSQLQMSGGITVASETLDLNGRSDPNATAHFSNASGNNTWGGNVVLDGGSGNHIIEATDPAGLLTISGNIIDDDDGDGNTVTLRLRGAGDGRIDGNFVDQDADPNDPANNFANMALVKEGAGTWTIATGSNQSTDFYQGNTTINEGTLEVLADLPNGTNGELASPTVAVASRFHIGYRRFFRLYNPVEPDSFGRRHDQCPNDQLLWQH